MVNICPKCKQGFMLPTHKTGNVVGDSFVVGEVSKCLRCEHEEIKSQVFVQVKVLINKPRGAGL